MVENDAKGWYGNFSHAGLFSATKYRLCGKIGEKISKIENRKYIIKDYFSPNDDDDIPKMNDSIDKKIDIIYSIVHNENPLPNLLKDTEKNKEITKSKSFSNFLYSEKKKYHYKYNKDYKKKKIEHPCPIYFPKMDFIWNKTIIGPKWKTMKGRNDNTEVDKKGFYINHQDISQTNKHVFIDMSKQTMRNGFPIAKDLRVRYEKKYSHEKDNNINDNNDNTSMRKSQSAANIKRKVTAIENKLYLPKGISKKCLLVPDFQKTISREKREKILGIKKADIQFATNNYDSVRERPIMMVVYKKRNNSFCFKNRIKGIESGAGLKLDEVYNKYNNHKEVKGPIFKSMIARPKGNDPLPSFMKEIYSKVNAYTITDKTLKMNNFSNAEYLSDYSSFFPKRSFNKYVNLNILNSKALDTNASKNKQELERLSDFLYKTERCSNQSFKQLWSENVLNKFDLVTFKANNHESKTERIKNNTDLFSYESITGKIK